MWICGAHSENNRETGIVAVSEMPAEQGLCFYVGVVMDSTYCALDRCGALLLLPLPPVEPGESLQYVLPSCAH
jgi:hypothetical protein